MRLTLRTHVIKAIDLGHDHGWRNGRLTVDPARVAALFPEGPGLRLLEVLAAGPGDTLRFGPVLDVVGLRCCGQGSAFPGITGPAAQGPDRTMDILAHGALAVVANLQGIQDGLIDMSAQAADYCPFAKTYNLVCVVDIDPGTDRREADTALRLFQGRVSESLAALAAQTAPDWERTLTWPLPEASGLPRVAAAYFVQGQGDLRRTLVSGVASDHLAPALMDPLELLAGAVVSGNYVMSCNKTCTFIHHQHPVVWEMLEGHGKTLDFAGVILANEGSQMETKQATALRVAELTVELGVQGVVLNQEGGGNSDTDIMLACQALEKAGVATVLMVNEFAGADGSTPSLTQTTPEARCIVSTGNNDQVIALGAPSRFAGHPLPAALGSQNPSGPVTVPLTRIYASTNQLGFNALSCESL